MTRRTETEPFALRLPLGAAERIRALLPIIGQERQRGQAGIGPVLRRWIMERLEQEEAATAITSASAPVDRCTDLLTRVKALLDDPDPALRARLERRIALTEDDRARKDRGR